MPRSFARLGVALFLVLLLAGCGGGNQPGSVEWRNVTIDLPDGWYLFEEAETRLSISNQDIGPAAVRGSVPDAAEPVVAMFFTYEPNTLPDDWRRYVDQQGATLESDDQFVLADDVPATRLIFSYETDGVPLREMVTVIPSRSIVVLAQPVPAAGASDGPDVFLRYVETFIDVLESLRFGAPVLD